MLEELRLVVPLDRPEKRPSERDQAGWLACLDARAHPFKPNHEWGVGSKDVVDTVKMH